MIAGRQGVAGIVQQRADNPVNVRVSQPWAVQHFAGNDLGARGRQLLILSSNVPKARQNTVSGKIRFLANQEVVFLDLSVFQPGEIDHRPIISHRGMYRCTYPSSA